MTGPSSDSQWTTTGVGVRPVLARGTAKPAPVKVIVVPGRPEPALRLRVARLAQANADAPRPTMKAPMATSTANLPGDSRTRTSVTNGSLPASVASPGSYGNEEL